MIGIFQTIKRMKKNTLELKNMSETKNMRLLVSRFPQQISINSKLKRSVEGANYFQPRLDCNIAFLKL